MATFGAVINGRAGGLNEKEAEERLVKLKQLLTPHLPAEALRVEQGSAIEAAARSLVEQGTEIILAGGGDGTVSSVAGVVAASGVGLAILPLGTRNHFARDLGLPLDFEEAVKVAFRQRWRRVDLGEVNGRPFLNNVSVGMYPRIIEQRQQRMRNRGWGKGFSHLAAALAVLARFPKMRLTLECDGQQVRRLTPIFFVGNNEYSGGVFEDSKREALDRGRLWFCTARTRGYGGLLRLAWRAVAGGYDDAAELETFAAAKGAAWFKGRGRRVAIDGENCLLEEPLRFRSRPGRLRVIGP